MCVSNLTSGNPDAHLWGKMLGPALFEGDTGERENE